MDDIALKTGVNSRAPLSERVAKTKTESVNGANTTALHKSQETTYDIDYTGKRRGDSFNPFMSQNFSKSDTRSTAAVGLSSTAAHSPNDEEKEAVLRALNGGKDPKALKAADSTKASSSVPGYRVTSDRACEWESTYHASTRGVQPTQQLDFYSSARKIEKIDDDNRGGRVGSVQRAVDIRNKRAQDPSMCPAEAHYPIMQRSQLPVIAAQEKGLVKRNYLDLVECDHRNPSTEEQFGYQDEPKTRLPPEDFSQEFAAQSKAITHMSTTEPLFKGTPKYIDDKPVGYGGHIPANDRNIEAMIHGEDARRTYAKSFMTLAVHGGGVDASVNTKNLKARHRGGQNALAAKQLKPKSQEAIDRTMEGFMLKQPIYQTSERERKMNIRDDAHAKSYF